VTHILLRLRESSNFVTYSTETKVTSNKSYSYLHTRDKSIIELMILRMLQHHYEPTLPLTRPTTSHHHRHRRQGPLHPTWRSRHRRRRPPTPSSSATAAIVAITGLVVAWCRLIPSSSSPLSSTADATPPTTASPPPRRVLLVILPPPSPSRPLRPLDRPWSHHGPACGANALPPGPTRQVPLPHAPPSSGDGPIAPAPPSRPPQCLGLLSSGRR
jgi:hypothetical protein